MSDHPHLTASDIRAYVGSTYFQRGKSYFEQGRVVSVDVTRADENGVRLRAGVLGSGGQTYQQTISIRWESYGPSLDGDCSCPVGYNCKHVAAACLEFASAPERVLRGSEGDPDKGWLTRVAAAGRDAERGDDTAGQERLVYLLKPSERGVEVELRIVRPLKTSGRLSKGRPVVLGNLPEVNAQAAYMRPGDAEILKLLRSLSTGSWPMVPLLAGSLGHLALERMLETGRCYWQQQTEQALAPGEPRPLDISWRQEAEGFLALAFDVADGVSGGSGGEGRILLTEPPLYLDPTRLAVGPLDTHGLKSAQLRELTRAPRLPPERAESVSRLLLKEFPELPLPLPTPVELVSVADADALPKLTLMGGRGWRRRRPSPATRVPLRRPPAPGAAQGVAQHHRHRARTRRCGPRPGGRGRRRDPAHSARLSARRRAAGRAGRSPSPPPARRRWSAPAAGPRYCATACRRWSSTAGGSTSTTAFGCASRPATGRPAIDDEEAEGNDWFGLRFDLEVDGRAAAGAHHRAAAGAGAGRGAAAGRQRAAARAEDGRRRTPLRRPAQRALAAGAGDPARAVRRRAAGARRQLRMSRFDVPALDDLAARGIALRGGERLRDLAQQLRDLSTASKRAAAGGPDHRAAALPAAAWTGCSSCAPSTSAASSPTTWASARRADPGPYPAREGGRSARPAQPGGRPTSLIGNWRREAERFTPALRVLVLHGSDRHERFAPSARHDLVLTTYPLLPRDRERLRRSLAPADPGRGADHQEPARPGRAGGAQLDARHRLCLTGTPMENHLGELWALFDFLLPGFLGDQQRFTPPLAHPIEQQGDASAAQRLARRVAPFLLRRRKQDVLTELPPKTEIVRSVGLGEAQRGLYEGIRLSMEKRVREPSPRRAWRAATSPSSTPC
jgi:hypothetical protein